MTVAELIEVLRKLPESAPVVVLDDTGYYRLSTARTTQAASPEPGREWAGDYGLGPAPGQEAVEVVVLDWAG